ncbi:hypothetical protein Droror1_Dr00016020 [Drosera rotundifolia]
MDCPRHYPNSEAIAHPLHFLFVARGKLWEVINGNGHLVTLYLPDVCLENAGVMSVCLTLVIMFSNVENTDLSVKKSRCSNSFNSRIEILAETGVHFRQLRTVKMRYIHQFGASLDFLEFIITRASNIETIT